MLEWRYGDQLDWRLVLIGLTESARQYEARGYTTVRGALGQISFRRYGMPFAPAPKERLSGTARACRAVVAARIVAPGSEWAVFGALQLANFTSALLLDDDRQLEQVLRGVPGVEAARTVGLLDSAEVTEAYERDRAESRTAAGSPGVSALEHHRGGGEAHGSVRAGGLLLQLREVLQQRPRRRRGQAAGRVDHAGGRRADGRRQ
ncbi:MAG: hypothetical protein ACR2JH_10625 [Solirubrobacteraceae bacterium]